MIFFLSDVHLSIDKPDITRFFLQFLETHATQAQAIYILGDLFDTWVGDDDFSPPTNKIRHAFKNLTNSNVAIYFQRGNRDFLIGEKFASETGVILLDDYAVIDLNGTKTLLTHGDLLCSDDIAYQQFRLKSHTENWKNNVLSKPLWLRLFAARWYRLRSFWHKRKKSYDIMDVNQQTVLNVLKKYDCLRLIHGHTHRAHVHYFEDENKKFERFVLAPWDKKQAEILCWNGASFQNVFIKCEKTKGDF